MSSFSWRPAVSRREVSWTKQKKLLGDLCLLLGAQHNALSLPYRLANVLTTRRSLPPGGTATIGVARPPASNEIGKHKYNI